MEELILELGFEAELEKALIKLIKDKKKNIEALAEKCREKGFAVLGKENDLMRLAVCLKYAEYTKEIYNQHNISDKIFYDTLKDIVIWCENNENKGLNNYRWIANHLKGELFRIGRLQYQIYKMGNKKLDYKQLPFNYGDNAIYVHIPQGEKLVYADCIHSITEAKSFFGKHFSNFEYRFFFSESWLLYEGNWLFMEPSSNILQFQSMFEIVANVPNAQQAIERIFGKKQVFKSKYPENTTLQIRAKDFIRNGGKLGIGVGIIDKNDL